MRLFSRFRKKKDGSGDRQDPREAIITRRLILRPFRTGDAVAFHRLNGDPKVMEFFPKTLSREESDEQLEQLIERSQAGDICFRAVTLKAGHFLGMGGLNRPRFEAPFMPVIEVAWRLVPASWGRGYATEAAGGALRHGFEELHLREIVAFTSPKNERSVRVIERLGMTRDPDGDFDHPRVPDGSPLKHHVLYRISRDEWHERHPPREDET